MGTFYHTTNYNPLTGDLNNMVKTENYIVDPKTGNGKLVAKKNYKRGHTNDALYSDPKGGHEIRNLPTKRIKA